MKIVTFKLKDGSSVASFFQEIFAEMGWEERESDYMDKPHLLFHLPDNGIVLLVKDNEKIIGTAGIISLPNNTGLMKRFYIKKEMRGTGIAQQLLEKIMKKAEKMGLTKVVLDVSKNNTRAIRFYKKSGFKLTEVDPQEGWPESFTPETHIYFYKKIY